MPLLPAALLRWAAAAFDSSQCRTPPARSGPMLDLLGNTVELTCSRGYLVCGRGSFPKLSPGERLERHSPSEPRYASLRSFAAIVLNPPPRIRRQVVNLQERLFSTDCTRRSGTSNSASTYIRRG